MRAVRGPAARGEGWLAGWALLGLMVFGATLPLRALAGPPGANGSTGVHTRRPRPSARSLPSPRVYEHWLRAELARAEGELSKAREQVLLALVYDERARSLQRALGELEVEVGSSRTARRALQALSRQDPSSARRLRALLRAREGDPAGGAAAARQAFEARRRWRPEGETWLALAVAAGSPRGPAARLAKLFPRRPEPHRVLAELEAVEADPLQALARARRHRERALAANEDHADLVAVIAMDHQLGDDRLAAERARVHLAASPSEAARRALAVRAACWADDLALALALAAEGERLSPGIALPVLVQEGVWFGAPGLRGRLDPALRSRFRPLLRAARRARQGLARASVPPGAEERSDAREAWAELAERLELGMPAPGDEARLRAGRIADPDDPFLLGLAGLLAEARGDGDHARKRLGRAARLDPGRWLSR